MKSLKEEQRIDDVESSNGGEVDRRVDVRRKERKFWKCDVEMEFSWNEFCR